MTHILHLYEDLELPLYKVEEFIKCIAQGNKPSNLTSICAKEKIDGFNFTFTVDGGFSGAEVKFLGSKGVSKKLAERGGLNRNELEQRFAENRKLADAMYLAHTNLQDVIDQSPEDQLLDLFEDGKVSLSCEVIDQRVKNVIDYNLPDNEEENQIIFCINLIDVETRKPIFDKKKIKQLNSFINAAIFYSNGKVQSLRDISLGEFSESELAGHLFAWNSLVESVKSHFKNKKVSLMYDLRAALVAKHLSFLTDNNWDFAVQKLAAERLATGDKSVLKKKDFADISQWKKFQEMESDRTVIVGEALIPLEHFFYSLGSTVIKHIKSTHTPRHRVSDTIEAVQDIIKAVTNDRIDADEKTLARIKSAALRCGTFLKDHQNFEGIVFDLKGEARKLTGTFTPINRLLSYFKFGKAKFK